jgi:fucose permease
LGAFTAPFVATHFSKSANHWYLFFVVSAGVGVSNSVCLYFVFKLRRQEVLLAAAGQPPREVNTVKENMFKQIFRLPALHCLSIFTIVYVGIEVTLGGWTVTFIQDVRGAGSSAGYISSCFFGGLMMGRVGLIWLTRKVGPRRVLFIYLTLAIVFSVTIWVVPFLVENFIAATLIGILLGPMYPIMLNYASQILPKWLVTPSIGWIAATGQAGSAIFPFLTGVISSKYGIRSLQPFVVAMMATLFVIWALLPRPPKQVN